MTLTSCACKYSDFDTDWYSDAEAALKIREIFSYHSASEFDFVNRKFWEWCVITRALKERGKLKNGATGLGCAVGTEPLTAFFASLGVKVLATDIVTEDAGGWIATNEHCADREALFFNALCGRATFQKNVAFQPMDMRQLDGLEGRFDFIWSSCALEHLGSLDAGLDYIFSSSEYLAEGGVAVHTTEFNVSSNTSTIEHGSAVVYRKADIQELEEDLARRGFKLVDPDFDAGRHKYDLDYDVAPYMVNGKPHVKLDIGGYVCTSYLLIIERL